MLRLAGGIGPPDCLENHTVCQHPARVLSEIGEELEFLRRQPDLFTISKHTEALAVDHQTTAHDGLTRKRWAIHSSQCRTNARQQFLSAKWLGDVVIGASVQRSHLGAFAPATPH